jgi:TRAP-type C4-dicarboxylate transport system substrate-binding protein
MKHKRTIALALAAVLALAFAADAFAQKAFKLGHVRPAGSPDDVAMKAFADAVAKGTSGRLKIEIYPASQLGNFTVVQERVGIGDVEMQLAPFGTNVTKGLGIVSTPYLVETWEQIPVVFAKNGKLMTAVTKMAEKEGLKILGLYPKYFGGIALSKMPKDPKGTGAKGMKVRVPGIKSFEKLADSLGYLATPIAFSEAFTSWQTGIVDGVIGSGAEGYWSSFRDLSKVYLPVNTHLEMWFLYISADAYKKLSAADRKVLDDAAAEMEKARFALAPTETKSYEDMLAKNGTQVVQFSAAELKAIADKVKAEVWPILRKDYGEELFDSVTR